MYLLVIMYIFKIFFSFLKDYKITVILYILFTILSFPLESIVVPQIYSNFFEILSIKTKKEIFLKYFLLIVIVLLIVNISNFLTTYIESYMIPKINEYIINYIYKKILKKNENNITEIEIGKIITRISTIPQYLKEFLTDFCVWIFPRFLAVLIINIYFFYINFNLGLLSIFLLIIFFTFNLKFFFSCLPASIERHTLFEIKNQNTQDKLINSHSIYSMGNLNKEINEYEFDTNIYTKKFTDNLKCLNKATIFTSMLIILIFISLNGTATYLFLNKKIDFKNLVAIFITIIYYTPCINTINTTMPTLIHYYGCLKSVDNFLKELYEIPISNKKNENENENLVKINKGNIIINNLNFSYDNKSKLFNNFYLTIKDKEKVAIIGQSGNGKSTLIKIIMGYYKLPDNSLFIDNKDINSYNLNDLRKQISYVNQNSKLFNKTLLENIQYGNNMKREDVILLIKKLNLNNIFKNLKDGLDTNVGIEGNNLSGGQKQMVHILRSIGRKNKIVILDEPTSAIDKENKDHIISAIKELSKDSLLIIITHDDLLLPCVDRIITLDAGKIVDDKYVNKNNLEI